MVQTVLGHMDRAGRISYRKPAGPVRSGVVADDPDRIGHGPSDSKHSCYIASDLSVSLRWRLRGPVEEASRDDRGRWSHRRHHLGPDLTVLLRDDAGLGDNPNHAGTLLFQRVPLAR